jgi:hypothetical protein
MPHARSTDFREELAEHIAIIRARTEGKEDVWGYLEQTREEAQYLIDVGILVSKTDHLAEVEDIEGLYDNGLIPAIEDKLSRAERRANALARENTDLKDAIVEMRPHSMQPPEFGVRWSDGRVDEYGNLTAAIAAFDKWNWPDREIYVEAIVVRDVSVSEWRDYDDRESASKSGAEELLRISVPESAPRRD